MRQLDTMVSNGEPLMKSIDKLGISYSNYNYWQKKRGVKSSRKKRGPAAAAATATSSGRGVLGVLDDMKANRASRSEHEKAIHALDAKFNQLKAKLGRG